MDRSSNNFFAFLTGAISGALLGVLFAPDKGAATREKLKQNLDKYKEKLEEFLNDLNQSGLLKGKENNDPKSQKVISEAKQKAEKLLDDVDKLIDQIKGKDN